MVSTALTDGSFYTVMPEFKTLSIKLKSLNVDIAKPKGCTGCQKRRIESNMFKDFLYVVQALDTNGIQRLKSYFKLDKLMINVQDPITKAISFKVV